MPTTDILEILKWWSGWLFLGVAGWPWARYFFNDWDDRGYSLSKVIGAFGTSYLVWVFGTLKLIPFHNSSVIFLGICLFLSGLFFYKQKKEKIKIDWIKIFAIELLFLGLIGFWVWVRGHSPEIRDLEKFMDYGFANIISRSEYFPPTDMWFAGEKINYYYFGHLTMAAVSKLTGQSLDITYNLMLSTLFALCFVLSFSIARRLLNNIPNKWKVVGGILTAYIVTMGGNLHTVYAFTKGYAFDEQNPPPFWMLLINPLDSDSVSAAKSTYWYPNATRFIPYTIHEFPSYSFVVSDIHGHVLSIPLALLAIAIIVNTFLKRRSINYKEVLFYGIVLGWLFTTNALDGPIYFGLFSLLAFTSELKFSENGKFNLLINQFDIKRLLTNILLVLIVFVTTSLPFLFHFKSFVSGVGVNCPPEIFAYKSNIAGDEGVNKFGPLVFGTVDKCQKSPIWMLAILWGFFAVCGAKILISKPNWGDKKLLIAMLIYCAGLILFSEFFYFKDIYPQHFRSNTMFKLGYQAFIILGILSGVVIANSFYKLKSNWKFVISIIPLLYFVVIYPSFSIKSYFGELSVENYEGLDGVAWLKNEHQDDLEVIYWLRSNSRDSDIVLEAAGDSYTDYSRISTFSGLATVAGWTVHEWLWRGDYAPIANRNDEVKIVYESPTSDEARAVINKYKIRFIVVGNLERKKYQNMQLSEVKKLGNVVFDTATTKLIEVN